MEPMTLGKLLFDFVLYVWPMKVIYPWEVGVKFSRGHYKKTLGSGLYGYLPFYSQIREVSTVPEPVSTPLMNITLRNGGSLTFSAMMVMQVVDAERALSAVDNYEESTVEMCSSLLAERLADAVPERVTPENVDRWKSLIDRVQRECATECEQFGVTVPSIRFNNYMMNPKAYRLVTDSSIKLSSQV